MLVLLPPSETKASGGDGGPVDLQSLSFPPLTATRRLVGDRLVALCHRRPGDARSVLGLSAAMDVDRRRDAELWTSPTMPAAHRYVGVLHDAIGYRHLPPAARRRADASLVILSGLWGAVSPSDPIPAYRIGIGVRLPGLSGLPALWHRPLRDALDERVAGLGAIDLRSSGYDRMYRPSPAALPRLLPVRLVGADGRAVPSYQSKVAKGALVRELLRRGVPSRQRLVSAAEHLGLSVEAAAGVEPAAGTLRLVMPAGWDAAVHILGE